MEIDFSVISLFGILILFVIILGLFIWQISIKKRVANHLIASLICGTIASVLMVQENVFLESRSIPWITVLVWELIFFAFQTFFFYLFLESLISIKINPYRLAIVLIFLVSHIISLYLVYLKYVYVEAFGTGAIIEDKFDDMFWIISDISYNVLAMVVYAAFGIPIYYNTYKFTKERKPVIFIVALILISLGYFISLLRDLNTYVNNPSEIVFAISEVSEYLKLLGLFMFIITYLLDVDYIYRLPFNIYILTVLYKDGNKIHTVRLKTSRKIQIEDVLLSGLISAINSVYSQTLETKSLIESISSKDASILLKSGEFITVVIVTDKGSAVLLNALERYVKEFEYKFHDLLKNQIVNMTAFESAKELIAAIFPFFQIESVD